MLYSSVDAELAEVQVNDQRPTAAPLGRSPVTVARSVIAPDPFLR